LTLKYIVALDAQKGTTIWGAKHGPGDCFVMNETDEGPCFTTSSPAVDSTLTYLKNKFWRDGG
jgi:hypothetical protein